MRTCIVWGQWRRKGDLDWNTIERGILYPALMTCVTVSRVIFVTGFTVLTLVAA